MMLPAPSRSMPTPARLDLGDLGAVEAQSTVDQPLPVALTQVSITDASRPRSYRTTRRIAVLWRRAADTEQRVERVRSATVPSCRARWPRVDPVADRRGVEHEGGACAHV
jgi:hypothetical protein